MRLVALAAAVALTIVAFPNVAAAQADHHANSKKAEFHLSSPLKVGTTTLKVGDYKFQCLRIDGVDFLVVTFADDGKEVARVPCTPEELTNNKDRFREELLGDRKNRFFSAYMAKAKQKMRIEVNRQALQRVIG